MASGRPQSPRAEANFSTDGVPSHWFCQSMRFGAGAPTPIGAASIWLSCLHMAHNADEVFGTHRRLPFYNCIAWMQWRPEPMHGAQVAAAANVLFD